VQAQPKPTEKVFCGIFEHDQSQAIVEDSKMPKKKQSLFAQRKAGNQKKAEVTEEAKV